MSKTLLALAKSFVHERLSANEFANAYMELWKFEGDNGILKLDEENLNECLSTIFCLADSYDEDPNVDFGELNEQQVRSAISEVIKNLKLR